MKRLVLPAMIVAGLLAWAPVQARDYVRVGGDDHGNAYLDRDSVTQIDSTTREARVIMILPRDWDMGAGMTIRQPDAKDNKNIAEVVMYFDCAGRRAAGRSFVIYSRTGEVHSREDSAEVNYFPVPPEAERMLDVACELVVPAADEIVQAGDILDLEARVNAPGG